MKIDKISIKNLTSFEGEYVIDFTQEPLRSASLFAITGDTGAGKSTILDAVCLALYNKAPRFDGMKTRKTETDEKKLGADDVRAMLRRGCNEAYSRVEFSMPDGARYEVGWSVRVKRTGNYDNVERSLRQLAPRKEKETVGKKEFNDRIRQIIGLDYEQFTRTVMLAQNSFANFLRAKDNEKSALLEKLTGTDIYARISMKIFEKNKEAQAQVASINDFIKGIMSNHLAPEELQEWKDKRTQVTSDINVTTARIGLAERQLGWFDDEEAARAEVEKREKDHTEANKNYVAMRSQELSLERYDQVQKVQPLYRKIVMRQDDIAANRAEGEALDAQIAAEKQMLNASAEDLEAAKKRLQDAEANQRQRQPAIHRGLVLSGEIKAAKEELKNIDERRKAAQGVCEERQSALNTKRTELDEAQKRLENREQHRLALSAYQQMFENFNLVKSKLASLTQEMQALERYSENYNRHQAEMEQHKKALKTYVERQHDAEGNLSRQKAELEIHRQYNRGKESAKLQERMTVCNNRLLGLERARNLWQRIAEGYEELDEKRDEIRRTEVAQSQLATDIDRAQRELATLEEVYNSFNKSYTLSQSKDIVQLRKQLKEGKACPVCGATHHPYHTETERELGELLNNLEKEYEEAKENLENKRKHLGDLKETWANNEGLLKASRRSLEERETQQRKDVAEWQTCAALDSSIADCSPSVSADARRQLIELLIDGAKKDATEAENELNEFNAHQTQINSLSESISTLEAQVNSDSKHIAGINTQYEVVRQAAENQDNLLKQSEKALETLYADLSGVLTISAWYADWKKNPEGFSQYLSTLYDDWRATCDDVNDLQGKVALLTNERASGEKQLTEAQSQLEQHQADYKQKQEMLNEKTEELTRDFGDSTPEQVGKALQSDVTAAREAEATARASHDESQRRLGQFQGSKQTLTQKRQTLEQELRDHKAELDLWFEQFNAAHPPMKFAELEDLFSSRHDWNALRSELDSLKEQRTLAATRLDAARTDLQKVNSRPDKPSGEGEETKPALAQTLSSLKQNLEEQQNNLSEINLKIMAHEKCEDEVRAHADELKAAETNAEEWKKLNDLLGSSDGKRFRELAQSFTFSFLVEHANIQLRQFSPRYELCNEKGTLTLEIIDRDMFDERRHVSSLSGGETFVVSLALALGLASLSSNSLAIGSLFIDEGFGNLDHDSLEIVMSALSNLDNVQGRKVGVISHTDQIRSQISPQIRIVKRPTGGRSSIRIG